MEQQSTRASNSIEDGLHELNAEQMIRSGKEKVSAMMDVVKQLQMTKKYLQLNAVEVKTSVHSNISRLLESLRSREVWLLNQVDVILQAKEDGLRGQEDRLNQILGRLTNCLSLLDSGAAVESELYDILKRIDFLEMHPVETPHFSFRSDTIGLRQSIQQFGRIDSKGLSLEAFASPQTSSSSIPKPFEDYEDDQHHVLYKTIHEIQEKQHGKSIDFKIPKLSKDIPSWVSPTHQPLGRWINGGNKPKAFRVADLQDDTSSTAYSINQWLKEIEMEEEVDDIATCQLSSNCRTGNQRTFSCTSESSKISRSHSEPMEKMMPRDGLSNAVRPLEKMETGAMCKKLPRSFFSFISNDPKDWLIDGAKEKSSSRGGGRAFEPYAFRLNRNVVCPKEKIIENYMKKISSLPSSAWLSAPPSPKRQKVDHVTSAEKMNVVSWLAPEQRDALPLLSHLRLNEMKEDGIMEKYAKKIALLPWLASGKNEGISEKHPTSLDCSDLIVSDKGSMLMEDYVRKISLLPWLLTAEDDKEPVCENYMEPERKNDMELVRENAMEPVRENAMEPVRENDMEPVRVKEKENILSISEYINKLNSFKREHWLLPKQCNQSLQPQVSSSKSGHNNMNVGLHAMENTKVTASWEPDFDGV